jgi:hypothetical protein
VERIERITMQSPTHRLVALIARVVIIFEKLVVVSVRVVVVDGTGAGGQIVLGDFVGADPDETAIFRDCKGVRITLEEWVSVECCVIAHRRVCKERIL